MANGFNNEYKNTATYKSRNKYNSANFAGEFKNKTPPLTDYVEKNANNEKKDIKKKSTEIAKLLTTFTAMISATVVGVVDIGIMQNPKTSVVATISEAFSTQYEDLDYSDVTYYVYLENFNDEDNIYVVLENYFTKRSEKVKDSFVEGVFEHLKSDMTYTLSVKQGNKILASQQIQTSIKDDKKQYYSEEPVNEQSPRTADDEPNEPVEEQNPQTSDSPEEEINNQNGGTYNG